jgi:hypothetical protein
MGIREEWQSRHKAIPLSPRSTIDELEALLNSDDEVEITILPNGEIVASDRKPRTEPLKPLTMRENLGGEYANTA